MRTLVVLLVLVGAATGAVLYAPDAVVHGIDDPIEGSTGDGPADDGSDGPADDGSDGATATPAPDDGVAFDYRIDEIEECSRTCRDVTATVENVGNETVENVVVEIEISTDGEVIWTGEVTVGTLEPGETFTTTERVEIGYGDALAVEANDGWIEIETVVRHDGGSQTFTEKRQVA